MNRSGEKIFWILVTILLFLIYGNKYGNYVHTFYFLVFFMPVVIATSWIFNSVLISNYLVKRKYILFSVYTFFLIIVSLDVEMVLIFLAFLLISIYDQESTGEIIANYKTLPLVMYFIILLYGFVSVVFRLLLQNEDKSKSTEDYILLRVNRENHRVRYTDILYIESMSDYVRIYLTNQDILVCREKISHLREKLPEVFLRIHRSYLINTDHISAYRKEYIIVSDKELPVSRTYKMDVEGYFSKG